MRDAAGELADGFHFLGLAVLFLELPLFGDVLRRADDAHDFALRAANRKGVVVNPPHLAVRTLDAIRFVVSPPVCAVFAARKTCSRSSG